MLRDTASRGLLTVILVLAALAGATAARAQAPIWANDWRVTAPTAFRSIGPARFDFSADGEFAYAQIADSGLDYQYTRLDAAGSVRWSVNLNTGFYTDRTASMPVLPLPGGGAVVGLDNGFAEWSRIAGIGADGSVLWLRALRAGALVVLPGQRVAATSCASITVLNAATGKVLWQYGDKGANVDLACLGNFVVADDDGNVYAMFAMPPFTAPAGIRTVKFDPLGNVVWQVSSLFDTGQSSATSMIGVSDGLVFELAYAHLRVLNALNGAAAWTLPLASSMAAVVLAGTPAEAVVFDDSSVSRRAKDSGSARWTTPVAGPVDHAANLDGDVAGFMEGAFVRIDSGTGSILWQQSLPATDSQDGPLAFVGFGSMGGNTVAVGSSYVAGASPPFLQKIDAATGALGDQIAVPGVPQGLVAASMPDDPAHLVVAAATLDVAPGNLRVRRLDRSTGAIVWEAVEPLAGGFYSVYGSVPSYGPSIASSASEVAVAASSDRVLEVAAFDLASGATRWVKQIADPFVASIEFAGPSIDADGNVYIEADVQFECNAFGNCCPGGALTCHALRLYKFAAVDGAILWRRDGPSAHAPSLILAAQSHDVLLGGPFDGSLTGATLARLSGSDGATVGWSSSVLSDDGVAAVFPLTDGTVEALGAGWARLDAATGQTLWSSPPVADPSCTQQSFCFVYDRIASSNGDLYSAGESNRMLRIERLRGDGSGIADFWYPVPAVPGARLAGTQIRSDAQGQLWLRMARSAGGPQTLATLASFDPVGGTLSAEQVLGLYDGSDNLAPSAGAAMLAAPDNEQLPVETLVSEQPLPATYGSALLDVAASAHGDLAVSAGLDGARVKAGDTAVFHFTATYTGDVPLTHARLIGALPWSSGLSDVSCTSHGSSNCVLDTRADAVDATFDIEPGGSVEITGHVGVLAGGQSDAPALYVVAFGPPGLAEADLANNFAKTATQQSIFFDGFE